MEHGTQIVSIAVLISIIINFFRNKRMPLLSTKLFTGFILLAFCNLLFEFFALFTLHQIDQVEPWLNRLSHQLYIGSLDLTIFFLFLYVDVKARQQRRYRRVELLWRLVPLLLAFVTVIVGRVEYYVGADGVYSYGPMAMTVYVSVVIYLLLVITQLHRHKECFENPERHTIFMGIAVWIVSAIIQFLYPMLLLAAMALAVMAIFVYVSVENPRAYGDYEIKDALNQRAYDLVLRERIESKQLFWVVNVAVVNEDLIRNTCGHQEVIHIIGHVASAMAAYTKKVVYHSQRQMVTVILDDKKACERILLEGLVNAIQKELKVDHEMADLRLSVLECPTYASSVSEIENIMYFVNSMIYDTKGRKQFVINSQFVDQYKYYATVERLLQKAIQEDGLDVYYQPIFSTKEKRYISAEALVRLKDTDTLGYVSPEIFVPLAEKRGLIDELGEIVFEKVCEFYKEHNLAGMGVEYIEVNLSGKQIVDPRLPELLLACMKKYDLSPSCINLEITETSVVKAEAVLARNMSRLQQEGFGFAMDDFGTGYSNLSQMANTGFDLIKLDKSLLWPCFEKDNKEAEVILNACLDMIHRLGRRIVAEGVETEEQAKMLTEKGVAYLQGYYFSKALPGEKYIEFMERAHS